MPEIIKPIEHLKRIYMSPKLWSKSFGVKNSLYKIFVTSRDDMKNIIKVIFQNISNTTARIVDRSFKNRIQLCGYNLLLSLPVS